MIDRVTILWFVMAIAAALGFLFAKIGEGTIWCEMSCRHRRTTPMHAGPVRDPKNREPQRRERTWACSCGEVWQELSFERKAEYDERMADLDIAASEKE